MSAIYICVAVSLGEIASRYPVSGGLYYWSHRLSPPKIASLVSYIVGWIAVVGNITVTLSVNFAYVYRFDHARLKLANQSEPHS